MIRQEILDDLKKELDEMTGNNTLGLVRSEYTYDERRERHQEYLIECIKEYGVIQYTDKLTLEEEDLDDKGLLQDEYAEYLRSNEL
jgi:hypothetical protein